MASDRRVVRRPTLIEATREVIARLELVERALARLPEGPGSAALAGDVTALREALHGLERLEREERRQLGHDLRAPLNAITGWTHVLRLETSAPSTVARAVDVFERNARTLARIIDTYTAEADG